MPYLHKTNALVPEFINLNKSVGANAPNQADDVKFLQRALLSIYSNRYVKISKTSGGLWAKPQTQLEVNGICDRATRLWIYKFQIDLAHQLNTEILIDGHVDPAAKVSSTIVYVNRILQLNNPDIYSTLLREFAPSTTRSLKALVSQTLRVPRIAH